MGVFQAGLLLPVAIGPVVGGALSGNLGWRSVFWFLAIYSAVFLVVLILVLPETLRSIVANGNKKPSSMILRFPLSFYQDKTSTAWNHEAEPIHLAKQKPIDVTGPFRILFSKHAAPIILFLAIHYAAWQMSITAMSSLFESHYGLTEVQIGLTFIANGAGSSIGTLLTGKILDKDYRRIQASREERLSDQEAMRGRGSPHLDRDQDFPLETARLRLVPIFALVQGLSILLFGWTIQYPEKVHIAVPIVSAFFTGWTAVSMQSVVMTYLIDIFSDKSAAASASLNLARCLVAAGGTSFIMPMVNGIGVGLAFTVCAILQALGLFGFLIQWRFAGLWRAEAESKRQLEASPGAESRSA